MAGDLVLLTGANGFLGSVTLLTALKAGYRVRATVRTQAKADLIKSHKDFQPYADKLEFAFIPDISAPNAYENALHDITHVLHTASPVVTGLADDVDLDVALINPAVEGTLSMLRQAQKTPTIKRVIVTSSIVAIIPLDKMTGNLSTTVYNQNSRIPSPEYSNLWSAYAASKAIALNRSLAFMESEKTNFDLINVFPGPIIGPGPFLTKDSFLEPMNISVMAVLLGKSGVGPFSGNAVHVQDVADVHVKSLSPSVAGNQGFIATSHVLEGNVWDDAAEIAKKAFPEAVASGVYPLGGDQPTHKTLIDSSNTEKTLGFEFRSFETIVKDVAGQYLQLVGV